MRSTDDLMPISASMHPSNRPDAGMTKGDAVPAPPAPEGSLYVVTSHTWDDQNWLEGLRPPEVYTSAAAANEAARRMMDRHAEMLNELGDSDNFNFLHNEDQECGDVGLYNGTLEWKGAHTAAVVRVFRVDGPDGTSDAQKTKGKAGKGKGGKIKVEPSDDEGGEDEEREDNDGDEEEDTKAITEHLSKVLAPRSSASAAGRRKLFAPAPAASPAVPSKGKGRTPAPAKTAVQTSTYRKKIPEGKPRCLKGLKILFTGTFETMDRKTSIATAVKYGAEVITKLEDTDYIVVGLRAGPKKLQEINEKELETISEEEFFQILENGVSKEKRERMAARRRADEEAREGEESEDDHASRPRPQRKRAKR